MTRTLYATVRRLLDAADGTPVNEPIPRHPRPVRFALNDFRPYSTGYFCEYEREAAGEHEQEAAGKQIVPKRFLDRLWTAWNSQVLLYVHGTDPPAATLEKNERLQKQCDHAEPGLVQVVPMFWPSPDRHARTDGNNHDTDTQPASVTPGDSIANGVGDVLRTLLRSRDHQPLANRKRISILAEGVGARMLRDALASWTHDAGPLYGAFRNIFLVAADIGQHTLEADRRGRCLSDAARNVTVYYANDDWAFSSTVMQHRRAATTRRLGQAGPADLSAMAQNVYAVDCDDVYAIDREDGGGGVPAESDKSPYFLAGSGSRGKPDPAGSGDRDTRETPGPVVTHFLYALRTGRVETDPATRTRMLAPDPAGNGRER